MWKTDTADVLQLPWQINPTNSIFDKSPGAVHTSSTVKLTKSYSAEMVQPRAVKIAQIKARTGQNAVSQPWMSFRQSLSSVIEVMALRVLRQKD